MADDDATPRRTTRASTGEPAKRATARKAPAKKAATPVKKASTPGKKAATPVKKASTPAKKAATPVKKAATPVKKAGAAAKKAATPARKRATPAKKAGTARVTSARSRTAAGEAPAPARKASGLLAAKPKKAPPLRLAAERTFADDWAPPPARPPREDPAARMRAVLRAAAASLEAKERGLPAPPVAAPASPTRPDDAPVTRVLVAPDLPEPDLEEYEFEVVEDDEDDVEIAAEEEADEEAQEEEEEDDGAWSPPEVIDDLQPPPPPPPRPRALPTVIMEPPPPFPRPVEEKRVGTGAGTSVLAIVLAVVVPVVGAVAGLVIATRARRRGASLAGLARAVSVLALVAWVVVGGWLAYLTLRDEGIDYSKLKVGDCFDSSASNEIRGVELKPCSQPHNSEIFFLVTHPAPPGNPYPGKDALVQFAADACLGAPLTEYLGISLEQSKLKDFEIVPQESAWKDGRRVLVCGIDTGGEGDITGSVKGTRR